MLQLAARFFTHTTETQNVTLDLYAFDDYQREARKTAIYPREQRVVYPALKLAGEAGEVAEKVGKIIRDSESKFHTAAARDSLKKEIGDVLWYCAAIASDLNLSLRDIADANLEKLASRQERGVLQGSGDER